eukprot:6535920-Alexandrium_andersonii.AAC.1
MQELPADRQAWLRSCAVPGAGTWLQPPRRQADKLATVTVNVAVLLRVGMLNTPGPFAITLGETDGGDANRRHDR